MRSSSSASATANVPSGMFRTTSPSSGSSLIPPLRGSNYSSVGTEPGKRGRSPCCLKASVRPDTPRASACYHPAATSRPRSRYAPAMPDPKLDDVDFHEQTDSPIYADDRNFYKVEKWARDGTEVDSLLYAGNSLGRAARVVRKCNQAPAVHPVDHPAAHAVAGSVAAAAAQNAMTEAPPPWTGEAEPAE